MAVLLALLSGLVWGTSDFLGGTASRRLPPLAVAGWAELFGLLTSVLACFAVRSFNGSDLRDVAGWSAAAGLSGFAALVCFYAALAVGTMGVVAPIAATGVVVPVAIGIAQGDRPSALQIVGLALAVVGVVLASGPELQGRAGARPLVLAALAALGFGLALTFIAKGSATSVTLTIMEMRLVTIVVLALVAVSVRSLGGVARRDLPVLATIGVTDIAANLMFAVASTLGLLSLVSVAGSLYPVSTVGLARVVHHERLGRIQYWGVGAALGGVALIASGGA